jgi:hypothetical protein
LVKPTTGRNASEADGPRFADCAFPERNAKPITIPSTAVVNAKLENALMPFTDDLLAISLKYL